LNKLSFNYRDENLRYRAFELQLLINLRRWNLWCYRGSVGVDEIAACVRIVE